MPTLESLEQDFNNLADVNDNLDVAKEHWESLLGHYHGQDMGYITTLFEMQSFINNVKEFIFKLNNLKAKIADLYKISVKSKEDVDVEVATALRSMHKECGRILEIHNNTCKKYNSNLQEFVKYFLDLPKRTKTSDKSDKIITDIEEKYKDAKKMLEWLDKQCENVLSPQKPNSTISLAYEMRI